MYQDRDGWCNKVSRKTCRREDAEARRERRLRDAVTFYVANLPNECTSQRLWKAFQHHGFIRDAYVAYKRDGGGNAFGFVRFSDVDDVRIWEKRLNETVIDGAKVSVNMARFTTIGKQPVIENKYYEMERNTGRKLPEVVQKGSETGGKPKGAYASKMVAGEAEVGKRFTPTSITIPPVDFVAKTNWEFRSLVGEILDFVTLENLGSLLKNVKFNGATVRYLGGFKILLTFPTKDFANAFLREETEFWAKMFHRLYFWEGGTVVFERLAWIKVVGVPPCLWDKQVFDSIGKTTGKLVKGSDVSIRDGVLTSSMMAVLVNKGSKVSMAIDLKWKDSKMKVWVEECNEDWVPLLFRTVVPSNRTSTSQGNAGGREKVTLGNQESTRVFECSVHGEVAVAGHVGPEVQSLNPNTDYGLRMGPDLEDQNLGGGPQITSNGPISNGEVRSGPEVGQLDLNRDPDDPFELEGLIRDTSKVMTRKKKKRKIRCSQLSKLLGILCSLKRGSMDQRRRGLKAGRSCKGMVSNRHRRLKLVA
ncbi:putative RNA recognition motif domain, nucleotide-binding alpha-beta plait domain superfamily [Helianthus annuus]|nr:putative RNA recognition motif domain, nucleotide-binding alpha-beta plait domain superfamily [Helianthus annuus]KAJ0621735.1 putative RNA recognition motif domain, nucleotide-binding alpha-beta plait domain superfamily [Helianthus annuus]KAJ0626146.1 putative RNA recognition motif domain, nucleotide-binding alpha-beta plait domain superfamily [Helianthus annuus]KAJ0782479.1 putative RNA recognition motif domain, nucleotide-binding alpha-beta plait domain superfamily [Helianthus annuus]KAJ09